jgi:Flp pilus assembly protein TadD
MSRMYTSGVFKTATQVAALIAVSQFFFVQLAGAASATASQSQQPAKPPSLSAAQYPAVDAKAQKTAEEIGDSLLMQGKFQGAIESYKKASQSSPMVWNKMGIAYQQLFSPDEAMRCYTTSLKLDPQDASVLNNLGTVYASLKDYRSADRYYRKAIKLDPKSAPILKNLGTNLLTRHKYKQGGEFYAAALAVDPHIFDSGATLQVSDPASAASRGALNYYMARSCMRAGLTDRAIQYLRLALNNGYTSPRKILADSEFASLYNIPAFEQLLSTQRNQ